MGSPLGLLLSTLALLGVSQLPDNQFHSWGWRIPFLLTAVLLAAGVRARVVVTESPEFHAAAERGHRGGVPLLHVRPWLVAGLLCVISLASALGVLASVHRTHSDASTLVPTQRDAPASRCAAEEAT